MGPLKCHIILLFRGQVVIKPFSGLSKITGVENHQDENQTPEKQFALLIEPYLVSIRSGDQNRIGHASRVRTMGNDFQIVIDEGVSIAYLE